MTKDSKSDPKEDAWRDTLGSVEQAGVSPSVARALLQLNPNMRDQGFNTASLVAESQNAKGGLQQPAQKQAGPGVFDVLGATKQRLDSDEQRITDAIAKLEQERKALRAAELKAFETWLQKNDADLRSPVTQDALGRHKPMLDRLGFSVKSYIDKHRAKK